MEFLLLGILSAVSVSIVEPVDGGVYDGDWLTLRTIVENENSLPDSVVFSPERRTVPAGAKAQYGLANLHAEQCSHRVLSVARPNDERCALDGAGHRWLARVRQSDRCRRRGLLVLQQRASYLHALNAATGSILWSYQTMGSGQIRLHTATEGSTSHLTRSTACTAITGSRVWTFPGDVNYGGTPCVMDGRVVCATTIAYPSYDTTVHCLSADDGQVLWERQLDGSIGNCIAGWNGMFIVGTEMAGGRLCALDASTGDVIWSNTTVEDGFHDTSPVIVDGKIYIGGEDGAVHRFDALSGALEWETPLSVEGYPVEPTPAVFDGTVICGYTPLPSEPGVLAALDMSDGSIVWSIPASIHGSPAVADGVVFWGGFWEEYGLINAADAATGGMIWSYDPNPGSMGLQSTPAITDGVMYIAASDDSLYAFGTGLKWTYRNDLFADVGSNELIIDSWSGGAVAASDTIQFTVTQTGIVTDPGSSYRPVLSVRPNPFASNTMVSFELDSPCWSSLRVFDISGRLVGTIQSGESQAGSHSLSWGGTDDSGGMLPSGIYTLVLSSPLGDVYRNSVSAEVNAGD